MTLREECEIDVAAAPSFCVVYGGRGDAECRREAGEGSWLRLVLLSLVLVCYRNKLAFKDTVRE